MIFLVLAWELTMPWAIGILLFTMAVMTLGSSLKADPDAFSEAGAASGAVSENTVRFGRLLIGGQSTVSNNDESDGSQSNEEGNLRSQT